MKKHLVIFLTVIASSLFVGCETEDDYTPPNYVTFESDELGLAVNEGTNETLEVTVYTANITGSDRTFNIMVDTASTLNPDSYTIPETIVIPANTNEATFTVDVTDNSIDNAGDTLVLTLDGGEEEVFTGDPLTIEVAKICEFDLSQTLTDTSGWFGEAFPVVIEEGTAPNQYIAKDLFSEGTDITFTVNADYTITVPKQNSFVHATYGQASVTGQAGSKLEPCLRKATLVLRHSVAAGNFGTFNEVFTVPVAPVPGEGDGSEGDGSEGDGSEGDGSEA